MAQSDWVLCAGNHSVEEEFCWPELSSGGSGHFFLAHGCRAQFLVVVGLISCPLTSVLGLLSFTWPALSSS